VTTTVARPEAAAARRIVIKVGSSVLARDGHLRSRVFGDIARQVASLLDEGREVVIVSSGAIAVGSRTLGWDGPGHSIPEKQAAAAVGQIGLIDLYGRRFAKYGRKVAQVLVTRVGLEDRDRFLNARHTLKKLLELGVVPIVNENDTVATDEIRFGDNDNLSATVLNLVGGDLLVILTDVDGLYADAPVPGAPTPPLIEVVDGITPAIERAAHGSAGRPRIGQRLRPRRDDDQAGGRPGRRPLRRPHRAVQRTRPRRPAACRVGRGTGDPLSGGKPPGKPQALARVHHAHAGRPGGRRRRPTGAARPRQEPARGRHHRGPG
jgi:isopentenyl phosphate kinase